MHAKRFWLDKTALAFAAVGVVLMMLTLHLHINPFEGSVVPDFLKEGAGLILFSILAWTCMPVWLPLLIVIDPLERLFSEQAAYYVFCGIVLAVQATVYFLLGKLIGWSVRKLRRTT